MLWLRGHHPKQPQTWPSLVKATELRVARWANGKLKLKRDEVLFEEHWKPYKLTFSRHQHGKCAYCELSIAADPNGGDVEHYRPKAEVTRLGDDPTTWGEEIEGHNSRDPKHPRQAPRISRGYWWLAYAWSNYLLSCGTCNQKWKGNLFPRRGDPTADPTSTNVVGETPLLLNPYGDVDPAEHLAFDKGGLVTPHKNSDIGWETIRTCCLGRETLRYARSLVAHDAWPRITRVLKELGCKPQNEARLRRALRDLLKLGDARRPHAGMVRAMWAQRDTYNLSWEKLKDLRDGLRP
jgi:hypothetical protein